MLKGCNQNFKLVTVFQHIIFIVEKLVQNFVSLWLTLGGGSPNREH